MNDTGPASKNKKTGAEPAAIAAGFVKMNLTSARRHAFLCTGPECCERAAGLATWEVLKAACKAAGAAALRSKADCLRVCAGGPWLVVYPEGTWYGGVTPERCERIVREHIAGGRPVAEWAVRTRPLEGGCAGDGPTACAPR
jgi:(2Fe-2S) ferredoxin